MRLFTVQPLSLRVLSPLMTPELPHSRELRFFRSWLRERLGLDDLPEDVRSREVRRSDRERFFTPLASFVD